MWVTQACLPSTGRDWVRTIDFRGAPCGVEGEVTIDVAVVYTPAAREAAGGAAAIESVIDLLIAETNQAYAESGVRHRMALAARSEVPYKETGDSFIDLEVPSALRSFEKKKWGFWCRQPTGLGDNEIWRISTLHGILYLPDVGSKTTSFSSAFAGIFASN